MTIEKRVQGLIEQQDVITSEIKKFSYSCDQAGYDKDFIETRLLEILERIGIEFLR
jgi:hypothetical protein